MAINDLPLFSQIKGRLTWLDERQRVIAQNVANADTPGYVGRDLNQPTDFARALAEVRPDMGDFRSEYDPSHPAANAEGYVLRPNVDTLVEAMDMREAQRAYEANLNIIETARAMDARTLDLLKK